MISSSNRVLKAHSVTVDTENKVIIEIPPVPEIEPELPEVESADPEEQAHNNAAKIIRSAEQQASLILTQARNEAASEQDAIIGAAQNEATRIRDEARESGYNEGMDKATGEGEIIVAEAERVLEEAKKWRKHMEDTLEPDMVQLIIDIVEKILADTVKLHPEAIMTLIKQGLDSTMASGDVKVYVSSDDYELVTSKKNELAAMADGSVNIEIIKDLSLNPMDSIISTPIGDIDVSLNQQYESIKAGLNNILNTGK
jgi:flagellar assembly protein FliH